MESSQLCATTLNHYSTEQQSTCHDYDPLLLIASYGRTYRIYSSIRRVSVHLAKPVYKTHSNGELCKTFFEVKLGKQLHDFTIVSNYHNNIVNTCSILFMVHRLAVVINPSQHYTRVEVSLIKTYFPCQRFEIKLCYVYIYYYI